MVKPFVFSESHSVNVLGPVGQDLQGKKWEVVLIETGLSSNGRFYSADALKGSLPLFEGLQACAYRYGLPLGGSEYNHLPEEQGGRGRNFVQNVVGWFESARYGSFKRPNGSTGEGVIAYFHVLEGHKWLRDNLKDAYKNGRADLLGFSIDARGSMRDGVVEGKRVKVVDRITEIFSTDIVSEPAAGGSFLRLVASKERGMESILALIEQHRPKWLSGFAKYDDQTEIKDYLFRVLESNAAQAQENFNATPADEVKTLAEAARGIKAINEAMQLIAQDKAKEASKIFESWIAKYPVSDNGYAFPFDSAVIGKVDGKEKQESSMADKEKVEEAAMKEAKEREEDLEKRERELALRETALKVQDKLSNSDLPEQAKERVAGLFKEKTEVTDEQINEAITKERTVESSEVLALATESVISKASSLFLGPTNRNLPCNPIFSPLSCSV